MWVPRFLAAGLLILAIATAAVSASDRDLAACNNPDPGARIPGCTRLLDRSMPDSVRSQIHLLRGLAYARKSQNELAKADYDEAIRLDPKNSEPYNALAHLYDLQGDVDRALGLYDQAIRLTPQSAIYFSNRGVLFAEKGDFEHGLADLDHALELDPTNSVLFFNRADALLDKGDLDRALADLDRALKFDSKSAGAFEGRGRIWRAKSEFDRAIAEYTKAIEIDPTETTAYAERGMAYESKGNYREARADYEKAVSLPRFKYRLAGSLGVGSFQRDMGTYQDTARARLAILSDATNPSHASVQQASVHPAASPQPSGAADKGRRVALVIGNGAYVNANRLLNPPNDARGVARSLREMGYEVYEGIDLDKAALQKQVAEFLRSVTTARLAVVFYAGHGMQIDGKNYLVPIDAKFDGLIDPSSIMTDVDTILAALDDKIRSNIVILDACRDNPLAQQKAAKAETQPGSSRSVIVRSGLAAPSGLGAGAMAGAGTLIAFATAPGRLALDGDGTNSPFSTALIRHISTPGLEVQQMLTRVRADVVATTRSEQVPWSDSSLIGEVFLVGSKP
jgi:tetratricopeptide (TPR) repeat protein